MHASTELLRSLSSYRRVPEHVLKDDKDSLDVTAVKLWTTAPVRIGLLTLVHGALEKTTVWASVRKQKSMATSEQSRHSSVGRGILQEP